MSNSPGVFHWQLHCGQAVLPSMALIWGGIIATSFPNKTNNSCFLIYTVVEFLQNLVLKLSEITFVSICKLEVGLTSGNCKQAFYLHKRPAGFQSVNALCNEDRQNFWSLPRHCDNQKASHVFKKTLPGVGGWAYPHWDFLRVTCFISNHIFSNNKIFATFEKIFWWCCPLQWRHHLCSSAFLYMYG